jgi:serine/threonine-protein kinase
VLDLGLGVLMDADDQSNFATADGIAVGTIDYMSPEQACGQDVDGRSDLYSLGCSVYHLITGRLPYPGDSPIERLGKRISGQPVPITELRPDLPSNLVRTLNKLLANRPEDRYQTGAEAAEALQALTRRKTPREAVSPAAPPVKAPPAPTPPPMPVIDTAPHPLPEVPRAVYPGWFQPLADLAERSPAGIVAVALTALLTSFVLGAVSALLIR